MIRPATENDIPDMLQIIQAAFEEYRDKLDPPSGVFKETADTIHRKWRTGGGLIATVDGQIAGCVLYQPEETYLYLGRLAVLPEFRGRGVSRALVEGVEAKARELKLPCVRLGVRTQLPGNRQMFEYLGYQVVSSAYHPGYTAPTYFYMEKQVL